MTSPANVELLIGTAVAAARERRFPAAVAALEEAVQLAPGRTDLRVELVRNLLESGQAERASFEAERVLQISPENADALNLMGVALKRLGRLDGAVDAFQRSARLDERLRSPLVNLGNALRQLGRLGDAVTAYRRALALEPDDADTLRLLGAVLCEQGESEEGLAQLGRAVALAPEDARCFYDRAVALFRLGRFVEALSDGERARKLAPDDRNCQRLYGIILRRQGRLAEAREVYEQILRGAPDDVATLEAYANLCGKSIGDFRTANTALKRALALQPDSVRIAARLCDMLMDSRYDVEGRFIDEAYAIAAPLVDGTPPPLESAENLRAVFQRTADFARLRRVGDLRELMRYWALNDNPGALHSLLCRVETFEDRELLIDHHRLWGRHLLRRIPERERLPPSPRPLAGRKVRIGLLSSDLRDHPVTYFALPIVEHYDRARAELYCYSFYPGQIDPVQRWIAARVDAFRLMPAAGMAETVAQIRADAIDVLVELGGSTRYNRLEVAAYRPAPVQVSWLGYPHSCGLETIDYILTDPFVEPPDTTLLIERPLRMPESWVCLGRLGFRDQAIDPVIPEERTGYLTFGTMNNPYKYTEALVALWARVLAEVPGSRFLFVRPEGGAEAFRRNIGAAFERCGVSGDRLEFVAVRGTHMEHYNRIDIALDTVPQTGGTTTCEALWMGVPTVTRFGPAFFERLSYSNLSNAGLRDLCGQTDEEYVAAAVTLAADRARRRDLRRSLRDQLRRSPLGQTRRWVAAFVDRAIDAVEPAAGGQSREKR
jgi:predicted O-linked N-acetylglucosamine transferase (SPINDLY family)